MPIKLKPSISLIWEGIKYLPHQIKGIQWMLNKERKGTYSQWSSDNTKTSKNLEEHLLIRGGIQADEMGLGKTIQMTAVMRSNPKELNLVIVPVSLQDTWIGVLVRAGFIVMIPKRTGSSYIWSKHVTCSNKTSIPGAGMAYVTNYEKINRYPSLFRFKFDRIILDEAHKIANNFTSNFKSICEIDAGIRWAMTGTPIVNTWIDLRSLLVFLGIPDDTLPFRFGNHSHIEEAARFIIHRSMDSLRSSIPCAPPVPIHHDHKLDFASTSEAEFYRGVQGAIQSTLCEDMNDIVESGPGMTFKLYLRLRQISIHPDVYIQSRRKGKEGLNYTRPLFNSPSTKFLALEKLIRQERNSEKPSRYIIFCQFTEEMKMLKEFLLGLKGLRLAVATFQGGMTDSQRTRALSYAKSEADVFLIQLQAGGCGLNLQEFNRVVFMSPWWTTALMNQAIARAVRIGQKDIVHIHRFLLNEEISKNIDDTMMAKAESKHMMLEELFNEVIKHN